MTTIVNSDIPRNVDGNALPEGIGADVWLVGAVLTLLTFGLVMVYSTTVASGDQTLAFNFIPVTNHLINMMMGILTMIALRYTPIVWWQGSGKLLLLLSLLSLVFVLLPGIGANVNGSTRWIALGGLRLQPAELTKVLMVVYVAGYLVRKREELGQFTQGIVMVGLVLVVLATLLLLQPDFGSVVVISATVMAMLFLGGVRFWHFLLCVVFAAALLALLVWIEPYRLQRVMSFMNPWSDPFDTGFQLVQALIAFGRGEWLGVGLGASIQKLYYLPHASNDFLLAVVGEELGLVGVTAVVALFAIVLWRGFAIARRAERMGLYYAARLAEGLSLLLVVQAMINMGVNMGLLPTKGLTLPLMSYGGSSMLASSLALGLLFAIDRTTQPRAEPER
ncbi:MAG: putative lipid II flippase FtsW [Hyphomicrobiales bacterium]